MSTTPLTTLLSIPLSQPLDPESLKPHLSSPPWHQIPGTFNFRSISHPPSVKENFIYRSGLLSSVSEEGKKEMVEVLGVRAVFDLRFNEERERDLEPELEGVEHFWLGIADVDRVAEGNDKWRTVSHDFLTFDCGLWRSWMKVRWSLSKHCFQAKRRGKKQKWLIMLL